MTGLAQNETTWSANTGGGEVVDRDLICSLHQVDCGSTGLSARRRSGRNDFIVSEDIAIA